MCFDGPTAKVSDMNTLVDNFQSCLVPHETRFIYNISRKSKENNGVFVNTRFFCRLLLYLSYLLCGGELYLFKLKVIYLKFLKGSNPTLSIYDPITASTVLLSCIKIN